MLQRIVVTSAFVACTLASTLLAGQTEFSADIVDLEKSGTPTQAKIYFAKDKLRVEAQNSGSRGGGAVIINFDAQTSTVLLPQQHMYMELPMQSQLQRQSYASAFFRTGDVEHACTDWQKMMNAKNGTCRKVGNDTVNGRSTVEYEGTSSSGEVNRVWLDPKLRFPVKWQGKNSGGELRNIQEGSQPSTLFEIPADFTKMQMPGGMPQPPQR